MTNGRKKKTDSNNNSRILPGFEEYNMVEEYIDVYGDKIRVYKSGNKEIIDSNGLRNRIPGTEGHAFMEGWYIINEEGEEISMLDDKEYNRIKAKYEYKGRLHVKIYNEFKEYTLEEGPDNCVCIEDKEIVPDCYWGLPVNDEEVDQKCSEIVNKIKDYKNLWDK
mgnify:CR=1 FL=1